MNTETKLELRGQLMNSPYYVVLYLACEALCAGDGRQDEYRYRISRRSAAIPPSFPVLGAGSRI